MFEGFQFSQASLQDYIDCPRRFQLRYLQEVAWPAPQVDSMLEQERHLQRGQAFHRMVQQYLLGIPDGKISRTIGADEDLARWWGNYLAADPAGTAGQRYVETTLTATLVGYRLVAKYDLVVITPGERALIFDWKTAVRPDTPKKVDALFARMQTRIYRYLLVCAGAHLNGNLPIPPEQVSMRYWFAEDPDAPVDFAYDATQYAADEQRLTEVLLELTARDPGQLWELTPVERRCAYCPYRSLCERGEAAGALALAEEEGEGTALESFDLDFDQIAEIAF